RACRTPGSSAQSTSGRASLAQLGRRSRVQAGRRLITDMALAAGRRRGSACAVRPRELLPRSLPEPAAHRRETQHEVRTFATTTAGLLRLADWLAEMNCTHAVMESTGVYWKPVWHILSDGDIELVLANAEHVRNCRDPQRLAA